MNILILLSAGVVTGLCSGLFGIGGGTIIVPLLFILLESGIISISTQDGTIAQQVIFTSLAVVVCNSIVSSYSHWRRGGTNFTYLSKLASGSAIGSILGALILVSISGLVIKIICGFFFLMMGYLFWRKEDKKNKFGQWIISRVVAVNLSIVGIIVGWISVILGIGGVVINVGILQAHGLSIKKAIGTSAACGLVISLCAVVTSMLIASSNGNSLLSFIHVPFFLSIALVAGIFSNLGARLAHRLKDNTLKKSFGLYLFIIASYFLFNAATLLGENW